MTTKRINCNKNGAPHITALQSSSNLHAMLLLLQHLKSKYNFSIGQVPNAHKSWLN